MIAQERSNHVFSRHVCRCPNHAHHHLRPQQLPSQIRLYSSCTVARHFVVSNDVVHESFSASADVYTSAYARIFPYGSLGYSRQPFLQMQPYLLQQSSRTRGGTLIGWPAVGQLSWEYYLFFAGLPGCLIGNQPGAVVRHHAETQYLWCIVYGHQRRPGQTCSRVVDSLQGVLGVFLREPLSDWQREARMLPPTGAPNETGAQREDRHISLKVYTYSAPLVTWHHTGVWSGM